jgi:hypothetical protein
MFVTGEKIMGTIESGTENEIVNASTMSKAEHKKRHVMLHNHLDELIADWVSHTGSFPSKCTVLELIKWSHGQTKKPTGDR